MMRTLSLVALLVLSALMLALGDHDVEGCASVGRRHDSIHIAEESAIIVWDPVKKIEHFIRSASFDAKSPDFGFLVPTPTQPTLAEVGSTIFRDLERWTEQRTVAKFRYTFHPALCCFPASATRAPGNKSVRVLAEQNVGGFKTTVLEADDTDSLSKWITEHGYSSDPELQSWLAPYVLAKWKITAFKIIQDPKSGALATTKPVRMSFATDRPFFPYREPEQKHVDPANAKEVDQPAPTEAQERRQHGGSRLLRVHFISDTRVDGKFGNNTAWHATTPWSDQLYDEQRKDLAKQTGIAETDLPARAWLTTFEDRASPRPGKEEVYFDPASDRSPIRPPDHIRYNEIWLPADMLLLGIVVVGYVGFRVIRGRSRKEHAAR